MDLVKFCVIFIALMGKLLNVFRIARFECCEGFEQIEGENGCTRGNVWTELSQARYGTILQKLTKLNHVLNQSYIVFKSIYISSDINGWRTLIINILIENFVYCSCTALYKYTKLFKS